MAKYSIKSYGRGGSGSSKAAAARQAVAKASRILRARGSGLSAPLRTGGWYGQSRFGRAGGGELKKVDTAINQIPSSNGTNCYTLLNGLTPGTDFINRVGRKCMMKSISIRGEYIPYPQGGSAGNDTARFVIIYDSQPNASTPAYSDFLDNTQGQNYILWLAHMNLNNRDRFKVLYDKILQGGPASYTSSLLTAGTAQPVKFYTYKKLNHEILFNSGTAGTVGDIQTGAMWCFMLSATGKWQVNAAIRIRYLDN